MMQNLAIKVFQEKYFNSIRYFAHTLPKAKREEFILQVGELNIYLAAQCVMSGEADPLLEDRLKLIAEIRAKEFTQPEISALGFLALAEFENFDIILNLLSSVAIISKLHSKVISNILSNASPDFFYKFLGTLSEVNHPPLIQNAIASYNGLVVVDSSNKEIFNKLITIFIQNGHYGTLRVMLNKFSIADEYEYLTGIPVEKSISAFLKSYKFTGINLAYELVVGNRLLGKFSAEILISHFIKTSGYKGIIKAIKLNEEYSIGRNANIDESIEKAISFFLGEFPPKQKKKRFKLVRNLFKKGGAEYLKQYNPELYQKAYHIISGQDDFIKIENFFRKQHENAYQLELGLAGAEVNTAFNQLLEEEKELKEIIVERAEEIIISLLKKWFSNPEKIKLEIILLLIIKQFDITFSALKNIMRKFIFRAEIIEKTKYGIYFKCEKLNTDKKLFLTRIKILKQETLLNFESSRISDKVFFYITDINPINFKLTILLQDVNNIDARILIE